MLLKQIGIVPDQVVSPDIDESPARNELPRPYAERMAAAKAAAAVSSDHLVLAADTVVSSGRRILPKPEDAADGPGVPDAAVRPAAPGIDGYRADRRRTGALRVGWSRALLRSIG